MSQLALLGGTPIRTKPFPAYKTVGEEEQKAVREVIETGVLSRFLGTWHDDFLGGPQVRALEEEWAAYFGSKHAISVNSATTGLYCAIGATGIGPGDEVIVSPYTMCTSATCALAFNAIPVFADIEQDYFCLDPDDVEAKITPRTKAIIVVNIFGSPYHADRINQIAKEHNLIVIEDNAQAPDATLHGRYTGTLGDMGVFSLNYHKHIHSGEGGVILTDNDELADRMRLIRNHAEAVVEKMGQTNLVNMIGFNFRMTEIEAAISRIQLKKLHQLVEDRLAHVQTFTQALQDIPGLILPKVRPDSRHVFYVYAIRFLEEQAGISRELFLKALRAELAPFEGRETEGITISEGYIRPLYLLPLFQKLIGYGDKGCPFSCQHYTGQVNYAAGICPIAEKMHYKELFAHDFIKPCLSESDLHDVIHAFQKVWENRDMLRSYNV